jgi:hypothetical protein
MRASAVGLHEGSKPHPAAQKRSRSSTSASIAQNALASPGNAERLLERAMGIEPMSETWASYQRVGFLSFSDVKLQPRHPL